MTWLNWPAELANELDHAYPHYRHNESLCLDLHGDPTQARLVIFSDGNHHMALAETLRAFSRANPNVGEIFYTTTPPRIMTEMFRAGGLEIGNFRLSVRPHVLISPPAVLELLVSEGLLQNSRPFMNSRGMVLLVHRDNPKSISGIKDLLRPDVRLFLSNPATANISYQIYTDCLRRLAMQHGVTLDFLAHPPGLPDPAKLVYGESIHHREAPQAIMEGRADTALMFYHLGLRYQRIFPEHFDFIWPAGSLGNQDCDISYANCGLVGDGGEWGAALLDFLKSDAVTKIYEYHGLARANV